MGVSKKLIKVEGGVAVETESKKWVVAGISVGSPLKPLVGKVQYNDVEEEEEECPTTPTAEEAKIPIRIMTCPAAPKKRKASSKCQFDGFRDFFIPPDLDSVFIRPGPGPGPGPACWAERA
ncbi:hypothetical protein LguiB_024751 [Lonicera macranthoides]